MRTLELTVNGFCWLCITYVLFIYIIYIVYMFYDLWPKEYFIFKDDQKLVYHITLEIALTSCVICTTLHIPRKISLVICED